MDYLKYLTEEIHTVVAATTDGEGLPVTCAIDMMDADEDGLYFLTAKGKGFYDRLKKGGYMALTGMKGEDTLSCVAVTVRGKVCELGEAQLPRLFEKNPYMSEIYPTEKSRQALTMFKLYDGSGEWFDLAIQSGYNAFCAGCRPRPLCCAVLPYDSMPAPARRAGHDPPPRAKSATRSGRIFLSGKEKGRRNTGVFQGLLTQSGGKIRPLRAHCTLIVLPYQKSR